MTKFKLKFLVVLFLSHHCFAQVNVTYSELDENIANPERGYYHHTSTNSGNYTLLNKETLINFREDEKITQILRLFYLSDFVESSISDEYLANMQIDFTTIREAGVKAIVRFAYSQGTTSPYGDATPEIVQTHISQLKSVLSNNADVIAVIQAGFVGTWGEWYYTDHFASSPGNLDDEDRANRKEVVTSLLDALPYDRMVQIRTPGYKMTLFDPNPLTEETAFSPDYLSRVGHHNDCFVASSTDFGTYVDIENEKNYLAQETLYTPMGGETCALASPHSDCENSSEELARFHWSYLNTDYNRDVLDEWDNQGCLEEIELKLGYRFIMNQGTFTTETKPEGTFSFSLDIENQGYANPYNPRNVEIILKNESNEEEYFLKLDENPRLWPLGESFTISVEAGIPEGMPEGTYKLYLNLPDPYILLNDKPAYSIQMANQDTWNEALGYNDLNATISIQNENTSDSYSGDSFFSAKTAVNIIELEGSEQIFGGSAEGQTIVYWGKQSSDHTRIIERSTDGVLYESIASLSGDIGYYLDFNVDESTNYFYRYYLINDTGQTERSGVITLSESEGQYVEIEIDGDMDDWGTTLPLASNIFSEDAKIIRVHFDSEHANFLIQGDISSYEIYLDTDNSMMTSDAQSDDVTDPMDYLISDSKLWTPGESGWVETSESVTVSTESNLIEIAVSQEAFTNLNDNQQIPIYVSLDNGNIILSDANSNTPIYQRSLPADTPEDLTVFNSESFPYSRLVLTWSECSNCLGYNIERSTDGAAFDVIGTYESSDLLARDDNLESGQTYYYRISAFNELGNAVYSEIVSATTGVVASTNPLSANVIQVYPNPTSSYLKIKYEDIRSISNIQIFSISGKKLETRFVENEEVITLDLTQLRPGIYFLETIVDNQKHVTRIIKK